jgi:hypothetical protein
MGETVMRDRDRLASDLERVLMELIAVYEAMASSAAERLAAIRGCDGARLTMIVRRENELVQRVAEIEKRRVGVVGTLADRLGLTDRSGTRIGQIADRLEDPWRERVRGLADRLRGLLTRVRRDNEVSGRAAASLSEHMGGLVRALAREMNHAKTYGRRGFVEAGPAVTSSVDVKS